ncbi:alpha/beta hydrolase [Kineococcus sp. DHX-1]|uniref:alpha/beta hydrolase n=1 Tax=Kineococcus sp. DHX-1 TaxID=3349638 RepID=UPI0036D3E6A4
MTVPYRPLPQDLSDVRYEHGPDSHPRPGVPRGTTTAWQLDAEAYPGTDRTVWTHVPAGLDPDRPAAVAVFNDGWWYLDPDGDVRGAVVLDNLVACGALPPTIGVFVDPGVCDGPRPKNRNVEYDAADDRYARCLVDEVLARVGREHRLSDDPADAVVVGGSSGGNAAFTAAWHRPDRFGQAVCFLASFAQMPGGNPYPRLLADGARRPVRWFLQAAHRDLGWNRPECNWFAENLRVAAALAESGHDVRLVVGDGGHSPQHAGVLLPDALRWALGPCT